MRLAPTLFLATLVAAQTSSSVVSNAPYSADEVIESIRTLADGTHITNDPIMGRVYRDSLGRTRRERPNLVRDPVSGTNSAGRLMVEIFDPVAQVRLSFSADDPRKIVRRTPWIDRSNLAPPALTAPGNLVTSESLGTKSIEGLSVEGTMTTTIWPAGSRGNDQPISVANEVWRSPELQIMVLSKTVSPLSGERTTRLTNIKRSEPSHDLFEPPPGYKILEPSRSLLPNRTVVDTSGPRQPGEMVDGAYRSGGGVTMPTLISKVEPEYSEDAREAKYSGNVLLSIVVSEEGVPHKIKVVRPLGMGLDEKAIEAVSKWRFKPGTKDGHPVPVIAQVEVSFNLL